MTRCAQSIPAPGGKSSSYKDGLACGGCDAPQVRKVEAIPANSEAFLRRALESAVKHTDRALFHGKGFADRMVCEVLANWNVIAFVSKVGLHSGTGGPVLMPAAQRPEQLRATLKILLTSMPSLGVDRFLVNSGDRQCAGSEFNVKSIRLKRENRRRPQTAAGCCRRISTSRDAWVF